MTVKEILTPIILQEFEKYERRGHKIQLKTVNKNCITYSVVCGLGMLFCCLPIFLPIYLVLMKKNNNVDVILSIAKKNPDTPIEKIIAQEIVI